MSILVAATALKLFGKTKIGKKDEQKALGIVGKAIGKLGGKKKRAGMETATVESFDPYTIAATGTKGIDRTKVADKIGDFLGKIKDKAGPIETDNKVTLSPTVLWGLGILGVAVLGYAALSRK